MKTDSALHRLSGAEDGCKALPSVKEAFKIDELEFSMIELFMMFALGLLTGILISLMFTPLIHARASRLAARHLTNELPINMAEVYADRDALRAKFALSVRQLEIRIEELTAKLTTTRAELGRKSNEINRLNGFGRIGQTRTAQDSRSPAGESVDRMDAPPPVPVSRHEQTSLRRCLAELERAETVNGFAASPESKLEILCESNKVH